jgi:hypothetical protein
MSTKPRSDSVLSQLTDEQRGQVYEWLITLGYTKTLERLAQPSPDGFDLETHRIATPCNASSGDTKTNRLPRTSPLRRRLPLSRLKIRLFLLLTPSNLTSVRATASRLAH